jgi:hypothetical protein
LNKRKAMTDHDNSSHHTDPAQSFARQEERETAEAFGASYEEYRRHVPVFVPRLSGLETA